jgi:hypothetical protein
MTSEPATYPGYRFPAEIISYAVWLYHVFGLSLRDVELIFSERSVTVSHESIRRHRQVVGLTAAFDRTAWHPSCSRCNLDARLLPPDPEGLGADIPVLNGCHQMPPRTEVAIEHRVG